MVINHVKQFVFVLVDDALGYGGFLVGGDLSGKTSRPNNEGFVETDETYKDATWVNEEVHLDVSKARHPVLPTNTSRFTSIVNGTRGYAIGDESKAASACATMGLVREPIVLVLFRKVALEGKM